MHASVMEWVAAKVAEHDLAGKTVLEVGSRNVNGSVRELFDGPYVGLDMEPGPGVDVVERADRLSYDDGSFDVVVTTEMLEHDPFFWATMSEISRVLTPGGMVLVTARGIGFRYHEYPSDYWRFTEDAIRHLFGWVGLREVEVVADPSPRHPGVFGLAVKPMVSFNRASVVRGVREPLTRSAVAR